MDNTIHMKKKYKNKNIKSTEILGRKVIIDGDEYIVSKDGKHISVTLNSEIVFSNDKEQRKSVSQWLKAIKKQNK